MDNPNPHPTSREPELFLSIRFSASLPDVLLEIASPKTTTTAGLKRLIRSRLPEELSTHRLRLIHAGKALEDSTPLSTSLKLSSFQGTSSSGSTPPYATAAKASTSPDDDGEDSPLDRKGKTPIRTEPKPRIYIHCSIGDVTLSASELAAEAAIASTTTTTALNAKTRNTSSTEAQEQQQHERNTTITTTTPAPRGFDRLLSAGFTVSEVSALRARFLDIQSLTRTPDMMPSGAELRALEERWMDDTTSSAVGPDTLADGGGGVMGGFGGGEDDGGTGSPLDDMLWGSVMGFFWPVGCSVWLLREEGVWSWRKGLAVFVGVVMNLILGTLRMMS